MVVILAAAELYGQKVNRELEFVHQPTVQEVKARAVAVFTDELNVRRLPGALPTGFHLHYVQLFDPATGRWSELKSTSQLKDYAQIYLFQKDSWNRESQGPIPSPTRPSPVPPHRAASAVSLPAHGSPARHPPRPVSHSVASLGLDAQAASAAAAAAAAAAATQQQLARLSPGRGVAPGSPQGDVRVSAAHLVALRDPRSPSVATYTDKVAMLFVSMVGDRHQADEEAFRNMFVRTRVGLEPAQIAQLFVQADTNGDSLISSAEWERFGEQYPTMIDAMFVRLRDHATDDEQKRSLEEFKKVLSDLEEYCYRDKCVMNEAAREVANVTEKAKRQADAVGEARSKERDTRAVMEAARTETERARATVAQRAAEVAHTQEAQTRRGQDHLDTQRVVEDAQLKARSMQSDTAAAERRLDELRAMLAEQEEVLRQTHAREQQGQEELEARMRESEDSLQKLNEAKNETQLALDRLCVSEQALTTAQQREEECGVQHIQSRDEVNKQLLRGEEEDQEVRVTSEKEAQARARYDESVAVLEAKQEEQRMLADANAAHNLKRDEEEEKEWPMLEQEFRLRQQRISLEEEEAKLRNEHRSFQSTTGR